MEIKVIRREKREFKLFEINEPCLKDLQESIRICKLRNPEFKIDLEDLSPAVFPLVAAFIHLKGKFDGSQLPVEDIEVLPIGFFIAVFPELSKFLST